MSLSLFNQSNLEPTNLLPEDGEAIYFPNFLDVAKANFYFNELLENLEWRNDENFIFGKKIITKRKVAWYGDKAYQYTYSKVAKNALIWDGNLLEIKNLIEKQSIDSYNSCLLNLYHDGNEGMGWHSDDEKDLLKNGTIASLSLGAERKFEFKHKNTGQKVQILLENGSLLLMRGETQTFWKHQLPKTKKVLQPRINLTFRTIVGQEGQIK